MRHMTAKAAGRLCGGVMAAAIVILMSALIPAAQAVAHSLPVGTYQGKRDCDNPSFAYFRLEVFDKPNQYTGADGIFNNLLNSKTYNGYWLYIHDDATGFRLDPLPRDHQNTTAPLWTLHIQPSDSQGLHYEGAIAGIRCPVHLIKEVPATAAERFPADYLPSSDPKPSDDALAEARAYHYGTGRPKDLQKALAAINDAFRLRYPTGMADHFWADTDPDYHKVLIDEFNAIWDDLTKARKPYVLVPLSQLILTEPAIKKFTVYYTVTTWSNYSLATDKHDGEYSGFQNVSKQQVVLKFTCPENNGGFDDGRRVEHVETIALQPGERIATPVIEVKGAETPHDVSYWVGNEQRYFDKSNWDMKCRVTPPGATNGFIP